MTTLVIVESPGKVKKISAILGDAFKVVASVGHVRDLPLKDIGVSAPDFAPHYEPTQRGKDVLAKLRKEAAAASRVLLATDPDREGEAIAWHLADALKLRNPERVTFTAITKEAVTSAISSPRQLDMQRVRAQEARRVLDRIVGYRVSPALSDRAGERLSAGRVQSPAVRLVVDREREIANFVATQHFGAELSFDDGKWRAVWDTKPHLAEGGKYITDKDLATRAAAVRNVTVTSFTDNKKGKAPAAPFTTSMLQQIAGRRLKLKPKKTMELAQRLYEQGAITYHRTDAPNMDAAGMEDIANYARSAGLPLSEKKRVWKAKEGAQEGHEAIRPTHAADLEAGESEEERALYKLIWQRAVASQLADAIYAVRTAVLSGEGFNYEATGRTLVTPGWMAVYDDSSDIDKDDEESTNPVPDLDTGAAVTATDGRILKKTTQPPRRFTQPTLVAEMERLGIGRPSTYAAILDNITSRTYVTEDKKGYLLPSPVGEKVRDALVTRFQFAELDYTRGLEDELDDIAEGKTTYEAVVSSAWSSLDDELSRLQKVEIAAAHPCPSCGKALRRLKGQYGFFWSCTGYPDCKESFPDNKGKPGDKKTGQSKAKAPTSGIPCPKCGKDLVRRVGTTAPKKIGGHLRPGRKYDFYSCSGYPNCDGSYETGTDGKPKLDK